MKHGMLLLSVVIVGCGGPQDPADRPINLDEKLKSLEYDGDQGNDWAIKQRPLGELDEKSDPLSVTWVIGIETKEPNSATWEHLVITKGVFAKASFIADSNFDTPYNIGLQMWGPHLRSDKLKILVDGVALDVDTNRDLMGLQVDVAEPQFVEILNADVVEGKAGTVRFQFPVFFREALRELHIRRSQVQSDWKDKNKRDDLLKTWQADWLKDHKDE